MRKAIREPKGLRVRRAQMALLEPRVPLVLQGQQDLKAPRARRVSLVRLVRRDRRAQQEPMERMVRMEPRSRPA